MACYCTARATHIRQGVQSRTRHDCNHDASSKRKQCSICGISMGISELLQTSIPGNTTWTVCSTSVLWPHTLFSETAHLCTETSCNCRLCHRICDRQTQTTLFNSKTAPCLPCNGKGGPYRLAHPPYHTCVLALAGKIKSKYPVVHAKHNQSYLFQLCAQPCCHLSKYCVVCDTRDFMSKVALCKSLQ
jgi:hypothetical protein